MCLTGVTCTRGTTQGPVSVTHVWTGGESGSEPSTLFTICNKFHIFSSDIYLFSLSPRTHAPVRTDQDVIQLFSDPPGLRVD